MSFLIESSARVLPRAIALSRAAAITAQAPRAFSTTVYMQKSATDNVKDGLKTVDRAVSDKLVDGLDAAGAARDKVKEVAGNKSAKGTVEELKGEAKGAAEKAKGKAKGAAEDVKQKL